MDAARGRPGSAVGMAVLAAASTAAAHPVAVVGGAVALALGLELQGWDVVIPPLAWASWGLVGLLRGVRLPGRVVAPAAEPELAQLVRRVAEDVGFAEPLLVRIVPEPEAGLGRARIDGSRVYVVLLGWPLLRTLSAAEVAAVLAHELAHRLHVCRPLAQALHRARADLVESLERRVRVPAAVSARLLRATQPQVWGTELAADAAGAAAVGTAASSAALQRVAVLDVVFGRYAVGWVEASIVAGRRPEDLYDALSLAVVDDLVERRARAFGAAEDGLDPYWAADHPPLAQRLAALPSQPDRGYGSEPVVLREATAVQEWCVRKLVSEIGDEPGELQPVRLLDSASGPLPQPVRETAQALREVTGERSTPAAVTAAVDAVADGTWPELARAIEPEVRRLPPLLRRAAERDVFGFCLGLVVSTALRDAGWEQVSRWTASVVQAPSGAVVDLHDLIDAALDSGDVAALRDLVAAGIAR